MISIGLAKPAEGPLYGLYAQGRVSDVDNEFVADGDPGVVQCAYINQVGNGSGVRRNFLLGYTLGAKCADDGGNVIRALPQADRVRIATTHTH